MEDIAVFFAGSTNLVEERNQIKAIANDLNANYKQRGVQVTIFTYEHLGEGQDAYNRFIASSADLAIFVFKDKNKRNEYTLEELHVATTAREEQGKPDILVFLHETDDTSINRNEGIVNELKNHLGRHHFLSYKTDDILKNKAKDRITKIINDRLEAKEKKTAKQHKGGRWISRLGWIFAAGILVGVFFSHNHKKEPLMLFVGGGSVSNYLKEAKGVDVNNWPNSLRVFLPSKLSWAVLAEEVNHKIPDPKNPLEFIPISLSAEKAIQEDFEGAFNRDEHRNRFSVAEYPLGVDTLVVYVDSELSDSFHLEESEYLNPERFAELLNYGIEKAHVYATSVDSGTRNTYLRALDGKDQHLLSADKIEIFNETSTTITTKEKNIFLGSSHYFVATLKESNHYTALKVVDTNGEVVAKSLYLYFPVKQDLVQNKPVLIIPTCVIDLLREIEKTADGSTKKILEGIKGNKDNYYVEMPDGVDPSSDIIVPIYQ